MAAAGKVESILGKLVRRLADWFDPRRDTCEIRCLSAAHVASIAKELRIPRAELENLVSHGRQGAAELRQLLQELGIDETAIARKEPGALRDMALVCALCVAKLRCIRELEAGTSAMHYHEYCANSFTIGAIDKVGRPEKSLP